MVCGGAGVLRSLHFSFLFQQIVCLDDCCVKPDMLIHKSFDISRSIKVDCEHTSYLLNQLMMLGFSDYMIKQSIHSNSVSNCA